MIFRLIAFISLVVACVTVGRELKAEAAAQACKSTVSGTEWTA